METCVFCKIVNGDVPCAKVYEDDQFIAFMDAFPTCDYQFLVIPKEHVKSRFSSVPDKVLKDIFPVVRKIAAHVDSVLGTNSCIVIEGELVPHLHVKVYPVKKEEALYMYFRKPFPKEMTAMSKLNELASKIRL